MKEFHGQSSSPSVWAERQYGLEQNSYQNNNYDDCHQYFLNSIVLLNALQLVTGATGLWSQGATAVNHGCSVHALGSGYGETTLLVSLHSSAALWNWVPSGVLPRKRHKLVALNVIFIKKQQPAGGGVSQQHSDRQHTSPSFGNLTRWIWLHK